jgi:hypothetical protein
MRWNYRNVIDIVTFLLDIEFLNVVRVRGKVGRKSKVTGGSKKKWEENCESKWMHLQTQRGEVGGPTAAGEGVSQGAPALLPSCAYFASRFTVGRRSRGGCGARGRSTHLHLHLHHYILNYLISLLLPSPSPSLSLLPPCISPLNPAQCSL